MFVVSTKVLYVCNHAAVVQYGKQFSRSRRDPPPPSPPLPPQRSAAAAAAARAGKHNIFIKSHNNNSHSYHKYVAEEYAMPSIPLFMIRFQ